MGKYSIFLVLFFFAVGVHSQTDSVSLPNFRGTPNGINFSNPYPVEGEEITISISVQNIGKTSPTLNEDLVVTLFEGNPKESPLRIMCRQVLIGLDVNQIKTIKARWRPPVGSTDIYAVINPENSEKYIRESDLTDNVVSTSLVASPRQFPHATPEQIEHAIDRGVEWIKSQRGRHSRLCLQCGVENQIVMGCVICGSTLKGLPEDLIPGSAWDFGEDSRQETAIGLLALLSAGVTVEDVVVQEGLDFLITQDWNNFAVYQFAIILPVLVATNDQRYRQRAQFAVDQIVAKQLLGGNDEFSDSRDDGGWGYGATADGAHMNMVIYSLYAAKQWGLEIPQETWIRAEKWIRRNQTQTGGWLYNLVDNGSPWADGVYGSMTATGLWALRACGVSTEDPQIQKGLAWIKKYWTLTRNPGALSWHYYYLLSLQRFADIPPRLDQLLGHDWYQEIADMLVVEQQANGQWVDSYAYFPTTCFALMFLARSIPKSVKPNLGLVNRSLRVSPPSPRVGEPMRLSVTVTNTGSPLDAIGEIDFFDGDLTRKGDPIASQHVIFTPNLGETTVSVDWIAKKMGNHQIYVVIDPQQQIEDIDRSNNSISQSIKIRPKSAEAIDPTAQVQKLSDSLYQIGNVLVETSEREVIINGTINIVNNNTILEFFASGKLGKTHESLIVLEAEPIHIQVALLRLGMNPGMNLTVQGDPHSPEGDLAKIWVEWQLQGQTVRRHAEELVWNSITDEPMQRTDWIMTGARIVNNQFTAQLFHNVIALYRDPDSIFNHPFVGGTDDRTFRVNSDVIPPKGTKIKMIIKPI